MEIKEQRSDVGKYWSFVDEATGAVDHSLNFFKEKLRSPSKQSITTIMPWYTIEPVHNRPSTQ